MNLMWLVAAWSSLCAVATGGLVWFIMHSRMEVRLARQREKLAEARATLEAQKQGIQGALQGVEETTRRKALDDFLADLRIELFPATPRKLSSPKVASLVTPGVSRTKESTRLPLTGSSWMARLSTTVETSLLVSSTMAAAAVTFTS